MTVNRRLLLRAHPTGEPREQDFALVEAPPPVPGEGDFVIHNHYVSLDPAIRGWIDDRPSYQQPVALGDPVRATTAGVVVESRNAAFPEGAHVTGLNAVEDFTLVRGGANRSRLVDPADPLTRHLSVLGGTGMTAYFGLLDVGRPIAGETVLVTAAAGGVGSLVGQIARIKGCRTIGIAGGQEKCRRLTDRYGFDVAIDYRGKDRDSLVAAIASAAPDGVDLLFENVGGQILDAGLLSLKTGGRVALCGLISDYNDQDHPYGSRQLWQLIVKRARIQGFLLSGYLDRLDEGAAAMRVWLEDGRIISDEHLEVGMHRVLPAFIGLFHGANQGKTIVRINGHSTERS